MKRFISLATLSCLALGSCALVGCESNDQLPPGDRGVYAGGNGAFGENPVDPGSYSNGSASGAPTTQPSPTR